MQFRKPFKIAIAAGKVTRTVRAWATPQAKLGGRYNIPPYGAIEVTRLRQLAPSALTPTDARRSGYETVAALQRALGKLPLGTQLTVVHFRYLGEAPVNQPKRSRAANPELTALKERIRQMDARSKRGPWAAATLKLIRANPGTRAADLAAELGWPTLAFKQNVRRLKALGLTESLEVGYRLSPRGKQVASTL